MSQSDEQALIEYITQIPPSVNAYSSVASHLRTLLEPPPTPSWVQWLQRTILLLFVIISIQASFLLYLRIKTRMFRRCMLNDLGFLQVNFFNSSAIGYLAYSILVISDILLEEAIEAGYQDQGAKIMLFGCKFIVILYSSWAFLWVCGCQCAALTWKPTGEPSYGKQNIPKIIPWIMNILLICTFIFPASVIFGSYGKANIEFNRVKYILLDVIEQLQHAALSYSPASYQEWQLLKMLIPAREVESHLTMVAKCVRTGIQTYFIVMIILCLVYIPLLIISLRSLYLPIKLPKDLESTLINSSDEKSMSLNSISEKTRRKRDFFVQHAAIAYTGTLVHLPVIIWQLTFTGDTFLRDPTWLIGTRLGLSGPFSIVGNICVLVLIRNARSELPDLKNVPKRASPNPINRDKFKSFQDKRTTQRIYKAQLLGNNVGTLEKSSTSSIMTEGDVSRSSEGTTGVDQCDCSMLTKVESKISIGD